MNIEEPATGIMKTSSWDDGTVCYRVECSCTDTDHGLDVWIEIDNEKDINQPQVTFYVTDHYPSWRGFFRRLKDAVGIVFGQPLTRHHSLLLEKQAALNFAAALNKSVEELENLRNDPGAN